MNIAQTIQNAAFKVDGYILPPPQQDNGLDGGLENTFELAMSECLMRLAEQMEQINA